MTVPKIPASQFRAFSEPTFLVSVRRNYFTVDTLANFLINHLDVKVILDDLQPIISPFALCGRWNRLEAARGVKRKERQRSVLFVLI